MATDSTSLLVSLCMFHSISVFFSGLLQVMPNISKYHLSHIQNSVVCSPHGFPTIFPMLFPVCHDYAKWFLQWFHPRTTVASSAPATEVMKTLRRRGWRKFDETGWACRKESPQIMYLYMYIIISKYMFVCIHIYI